MLLLEPLEVLRFRPALVNFDVWVLLVLAVPVTVVHLETEIGSFNLDLLVAVLIASPPLTVQLIVASGRNNFPWAFDEFLDCIRILGGERVHHRGLAQDTSEGAVPPA